MQPINLTFICEQINFNIYCLVLVDEKELI